MADRMKRFAALLVASSALVLGFDKIGGIDMAPGPDLGFACHIGPNANAHALSLSADHGDIRCFVRLRLRPQGAAPRRLGAQLSDGTPLQVWSGTYDPHGTLTLSIYQPGPARGKFLWPSGVDLWISDAGLALLGAKVDDWSVFLSDNQHDSLGKATWRWSWRWLCRFFAGVAILGVVFTTLKKDSTRLSFTPEACVAHVINSIEGETAAETERLRLLLKKVVLEGAPAAEARDSLAGSPVERARLWFKARNLFLVHLDHLLEKLSAFRADLSP